MKLDNHEKLVEARIVDNEGFTICPLCLKHISAIGFCDRIRGRRNFLCQSELTFA